MNIGKRRGGSPRLRAAILGTAVALGLATALPGAAIAGVHDSTSFELDGNAVTTTSHDWDQVCFQKTTNAATCGTSTPAGAAAVAWVSEPNTSASIFTGGGSKDPSDLNTWAWKDAGGLPDKDNLTHGFAARYGDTIFFGSDRYDNSGDAQQGFWFLQDNVGLGSTPLNGGFNFVGRHQAGDILVISDFSNGGGTSTISVYTWDTSCKKAASSSPQPGQCGDANLRLQETSTSANCASAPANDRFCGITNVANGTTAPWPYTDKSGNHTYLSGEFLEGGIDLTAIGLGDRCFASFASETRSSTSTTAQLKDFVLGGFGHCGSSAVTQALSGGQPITGHLSIGTGTVASSDSATVSVTGVTNWAGSAQFSLRGPIGAANEITANIGAPVPMDQTNSTVTGPSAIVTSAGDYCWHVSFTATTAGVPPAQDDGTNECFTVDPVTPHLSTQGGPSVTYGNPVTDTATLASTATGPATPVLYAAGTSPTTSGAPAGGTITWVLKGPNSCTADAVALSGTTSTLSTTVSGDGAYGPASFTPNATGTYHWIATWAPAAGDPNNIGSSGACGDPNEDVVVTTVQTSLTSAQSYVPNDEVTIAPAGDGTHPAGTVTFQLFASSDCTGAQIGSDMTDSVTAADHVADSSNTVSGTWPAVSWKVSFVPTNPAYETIPGTCLENTAVTIDDGGVASSR